MAIKKALPPLLTTLLSGTLSVAWADTVWLNNGDRLTGTVRYLSDGKLGLDTEYGGTLTLTWSAVSTLASNNPFVVENKKTGENYHVTLTAGDPGYVWVRRDDERQQQKVSVKRIDDFMKEKVRTDTLSWTGNIDAGVNIKKSSTKTDDYNFSLNTKLSQGRWRHDIGATYNREQENESVNTDNYSLRYAFDYIFREQYFWQTRGTYKRDWVEDVSRQALIGTGPGYQLWDTELSSFSVSILAGAFGYGYSDGSSDDHLGTSIRWNYQRYLLAKKVTLYSNGDIGHSLDEDGIFTMDAEVGLRYSLTSWSTWHIGYHKNLVHGTRDNLNEGTFSTGLGVKW